MSRNDDKSPNLTAGLLARHEQERKRLAAKLHDDVSQRLAVLATQLSALLMRVTDSAADLKDDLRGFKSSLRDVSDQVRRISYELHPSVLQHFGLAAALQSYCDEVSSLTDVKLRFRQRGVPESVPDDMALCLYRAAQECCRNIVAHSGAKRGSVVLEGAADAIQLTISDSGSGFDPGRVAEGFGLAILTERVRLAGGAVSVRSRPGSGTKVKVRLPLDANRS
jgi:signal transduction histidine kinase